MGNQNSRLQRREFVGMSLLGACTAGGSFSILQAAEWTEQEKINVQIVNDFCAAWSTREISRPLTFLTNDCVYRMTATTPPANGHDGVIQRLKSYVDATDQLEFKVIETFAKASIVMNHRIDSFISKTRQLIWEGVGVFLIQDGKIKEWSDYTIRVTR